MTAPRAVTVSAPSRLHFGLMSFGQGHDRQFGGVGVMIDRPRFVLTARTSGHFAVGGASSEVVTKYAKRVLAHLNHADFLAEIAVQQAPRPHVGLGTGTQIGLSVAKAMHALLGLESIDSIRLAKVAGRGARSAVGTHGFQDGGLIFDEGKQCDEEVGRMGARIELPPSWRFMLIIPNDSEGLSGTHERHAFEQLPPIPQAASQTLREIAAGEIIPAARAANIDAFGDAVYRYGHLAGTCFATQQHGPYATEMTQHIVDGLRASGIRGVGQSSWGPTVFAVVRESEVEGAVELARGLLPAGDSQIVVAAPDATGAVMEIDR